MGNTTKVALDSNGLSYLLDGIYSITGPTGALAAEQLALVRVMFYDEWGLYVVPTVVGECGRIRDDVRAAIHASWLDTLITETQPILPANIPVRAAELQQWHTDLDDCRIVAECEDAGIRTLLTHDHDLIGRLGTKTNVDLLRPTEYWQSLQILKGTRPQSRPADGNPLASMDWWRW